MPRSMIIDGEETIFNDNGSMIVDGELHERDSLGNWKRTNHSSKRFLSSAINEYFYKNDPEHWIPNPYWTMIQNKDFRLGDIKDIKKGHFVSVEDERVDEKISAEIILWILSTLKGKWLYLSCVEFEFFDKNDYTMFMVMWSEYLNIEGMKYHYERDYE